MQCFMASILFGGDEQHSEENSPHKDLLSRLKRENTVTFVNDGLGMLFELFRGRAEGLSALVPKTYDVIMYDSQLFFSGCDAQKRAELFEERVVDYLNFAQTPVFVLGDANTIQNIQSVAEKAGFIFVAPQYFIDAVMQAVKDATVKK